MSIPKEFKLLERREIPSRKMTALRFRHSCGLEVLSIECADPENMFALCFSTKPENSTGVQHIIEHSVLCGSAKYPVKDPFIEMVKSSLATFINACTYNDRTIYHCASCDRTDLFNLMDVYWDAVFHPNITKNDFAQEGWHREITGQGAKRKLLNNGIVLNEMRGYYSSFNTIMERSIMRYLLPDTPLACDSGGDPEVIPSLTYEYYHDFYKKHYAQGRCKVYFYGNIPTEDKLKFVAEHLKAEEKLEKCVQTPEKRTVQKCWTAPRSQRVLFAPEQAKDDRGGLALAWFIDDKRDLELDLTMQLLDFILEGNGGAPISKALLSSGLGTAMIPCGVENDYLESFFQLGLRGVKEKDLDKVSEIIMQTLEDVVKNGFTKDQKLAALREFRYDQQMIERLQCMDVLGEVMCNWIYGLDPLLFVDIDQAWKKVTEHIENEPGYLEGIIQRYLIDNPHRLRLDIVADTKLKQRNKAAEEKRLATELAAMSATQIEEIIENARNLKLAQSKANSPEDLATLPRFEVKDLAKKPLSLPVTETSLCKLPAYIGNLSGNGITYMNMLYDMQAMPKKYRENLYFFDALFCRVGIKGCTYDKWAQKLVTQSTHFLISHATCQEMKPGVQHGALSMTLAMSCLDECLPQSLELLQTEWDNKVFTETKRITEVLKQRWTRFTSTLAHTRGLAQTRAGAGLSHDATALELEGGWLGAEKCRDLVKCQGKELAPLQENLAETLKWMQKQRPVLVSMVGGERSEQQMENFLSDFLAGRKSSPKVKCEALPVWKLPAYGRKEWLDTTANGANCAMVMQAPGNDDERTPALLIICNLLSCGYLWNEVRMKNGAYGVGSSFSPARRLLQFYSSEDPRPLNTLEIFRNIRNLGLSRQWTSADIKSGILAVAKTMAYMPLNPAFLPLIASGHAYSGYTEEDIAKRYDAVKRQTLKSVRQAWDSFWEEFGDTANFAVVAPKQLCTDKSFQLFSL